MKKNQQHQQGVVILEVLVSFVIFAVGVLGIVGLQTVTAKAGVDARFRTEAAGLADELVARAQTWSVPSTLEANYRSNAGGVTGGTEYQAWYDNRLGRAASGLPAAQAEVTFPTPFTATGAGALMSVEVSWQSPGATDRSSHTTVAALPGNGGN